MQAISKLRKVLGDKPRQPDYIETIPKKGYRLIASVREAPALINSPVQPEVPFVWESAPQQVGMFTGFIERLTKPKFLLAFLLFSAVLIMVLGNLGYIIFWLSV